MDERSSLGTVSKRGCFFRNARARNTHVEATFNHPCAAQVGDAVVAYADAAPDALYACEANPRPSGPRGLILHYVVDPTGWGIQYGGPYTTAPKACANATLGDAPFGDVYNPACDLGTC